MEAYKVKVGDLIWSNVLKRLGYVLSYYDKPQERFYTIKWFEVDEDGDLESVSKYPTSLINQRIHKNLWKVYPK